MTELYRYMTPSWLNAAPTLDQLMKSLTRDTYVATHTTAAERPYSEAPERPPLYPFSPM
ncbi:hypothetical protein [Shimia sediminis]|uniref:hypothetical protein n=1 Tax=Shimia sediminis TaxID=2497945 RepID=UPI0013DFB8AF|nr:hypothetical protein [Shimia sediminis]